MELNGYLHLLHVWHLAYSNPELLVFSFLVGVGMTLKAMSRDDEHGHPERRSPDALLRRHVADRRSPLPVVAEPYDHLGAIMDYEAGELSDVDTIQLFQYLVNSGLAWTLQGHYGRVAQSMLDQGLIIRPIGDGP